MSNNEKNKSDFDKMFDDLFKDQLKKDNEAPEAEDELDDDIINEILNSKKNTDDDDDDDDQLKEVKDDDDNFDWLKDLIDDIDREEQDKKKIASNTTPAVQPKPLKPSFTSKLSEKPRPPKPPEHIANWGLGKKTVVLPPQNSGMAIKDSFFDKTKTHIYYIFFIVFLISSASLVFYNMIPNSKGDLCHDSNIVLRNVYSGDKILIDVHEVTNSGLDVIKKGYIDAQISNLMYRLVKPGEKVIDVGAGFGYYTLYLARIVGSSGQVYSFEARKNIFELLDSSIRINRFHNVKTFNNVLLTENRRLLLDTKNYQKRSNFGVSNLILDYENIHSNNDKSEFVDGVSLDSVLSDVTNIAMLHINANGNELSIILGAQRLIAASPKIKIITSWSKHQMTKYVNVHNVVTQLVDSGFRFWMIKPSNGTLIELSKVEHILQVERGRFLIAKSLQ